MISAVIYDMDGLLIDSEPFWRQAEIEVFETVGVTLTEELCRETMGLRIDGLVQYWFERFPWQSKPREAVAREVAERVAELISLNADALPGVEASLAFFAERQLPLAVCSSSPQTVIDAALRRLGVKKQMKVVHSADAEAFGKPHPAPYLTVAQRLQTSPQRCLVFEDSLNGAISGKAARMKVVAVPEARLRASTLFDFCDAKLDSLAEVSAELLERLA
ncbi:MAG TPA: hexitol phosphatase HxpB [Polyangiaceae bacterium]|jgi:sugar-phosphatase